MISLVLPQVDWQTPSRQQNQNKNKNKTSGFLGNIG
jgi:hypothetical protein